MKRVIAVVATLALASTQAIALTGTDLYQLCIESKKGSEADGSLYARRHEDNALRAFYVRGFIDGFDDGTWAHSWGIKICVPDEGISVDQGRLILEKRLRESTLNSCTLRRARFSGLRWRMRSDVHQNRTLPDERPIAPGKTTIPRESPASTGLFLC
jgi:hypothetical protein